MRDAFFSEEDLDLRHLSFAELNRVWNQWLRQAQATNDLDRYEYSHGVFTREPVAAATEPHGGRQGSGRKDTNSARVEPKPPASSVAGEHGPRRGPGEASLSAK